MGKHLTYDDRIQRFMDKVIPEPNSGCWLWIGASRPRGYAECWAFGRREQAHRAAYREFVGEIPAELVVRHKCDVACCVNPAHLEVGTQADNIADKSIRGRMPVGELHVGSKLSDAAVRDILTSDASLSQMAKKYGVVKATISNVRNRRRWRHIE